MCSLPISKIAICINLRGYLDFWVILRRKSINIFLQQETIISAGYIATVGDREEQADVSPLELHFEQNFSNAYGIQALKYLSREYGICDENGKNYFLDYLVKTKECKYAVEENGVTYHHPQIIGEERYRNQLRKKIHVHYGG